MMTGIKNILKVSLQVMGTLVVAVLLGIGLGEVVTFGYEKFMIYYVDQLTLAERYQLMKEGTWISHYKQWVR